MWLTTIHTQQSTSLAREGPKIARCRFFQGACGLAASRNTQELAANAESFFSAYCVCRVYSRVWRKSRGDLHADAISADSPQLSRCFIRSRDCANSDHTSLNSRM